MLLFTPKNKKPKLHEFVFRPKNKRRKIKKNAFFGAENEK